MKKIIMVLSLLSFAVGVHAAEEVTKEVFIKYRVKSIDLIHQGQSVTLMRDQDRSTEIVDFYKPTHRGKIQAMNPFKPHQVETIGELEMIDYLKQVSEGDDSVIIVDSRTPAWVKRSGVLPGAVNLPFTLFKSSDNAVEVMEDNFDVLVGETFNFSNAKTLVMYCNGAWCAQSPTAIKKLLAMGYPAAKIKYYRGGMQSWKSLGLNTF